MKELLRKNAFFFIPYIFFLALSSCVLLLSDKASIHLFINYFYNSFFDYFFKYFTHLADGIFILVLGILILFFSRKKGLFLLVSFGLSSLITQILKQVVYNEHLRPSVFFKDFNNLHIVQGVEIHGYFSFPSGHSVTAFCFATCLVISGSNRVLQFSMFLYAFTAAYSRMYLSQHFLIDILIGSVIGVLSAITLYPLFYKWAYLNEHPLLNKTIIK